MLDWPGGRVGVQVCVFVEFRAPTPDLGCVSVWHCVYWECVGVHRTVDGRHSQQRKREAGVCACGCVGVHSLLAIPTFLGVIS